MADVELTNKNTAKFFLKHIFLSRFRTFEQVYQNLECLKNECICTSECEQLVIRTSEFEKLIFTTSEFGHLVIRTSDFEHLVIRI